MGSTIIAVQGYVGCEVLQILGRGAWEPRSTKMVGGCGSCTPTPCGGRRMPLKGASNLRCLISICMQRREHCDICMIDMQSLAKDAGVQQLFDLIQSLRKKHSPPLKIFRGRSGQVMKRPSKKKAAGLDVEEDEDCKDAQTEEAEDQEEEQEEEEDMDDEEQEVEEEQENQIGEGEDKDEQAQDKNLEKRKKKTKSCAKGGSAKGGAGHGGCKAGKGVGSKTPRTPGMPSKDQPKPSRPASMQKKLPVTPEKETPTRRFSRKGSTEDDDLVFLSSSVPEKEVQMRLELASVTKKIESMRLLMLGP